MMTKTIRSPFNHEVGGTVEGCTILEKTVIIPPNPAEQRRGIYDYLVEVAPAPVKSPAKPKASKTMSATSRSANTRPEPESFTRATPDEMGSVIRRVGRR